MLAKITAVKMKNANRKLPDIDGQFRFALSKNYRSDKTLGSFHDFAGFETTRADFDAVCRAID
jgi:hypothetical protein